MPRLREHGVQARRGSEGIPKRLAAIWTRELCAEHNGTIASFEAAGSRLPDLAEYRTILAPKVLNLRRAGTIVASSIGVSSRAPRGPSQALP